MDNKGRPCRALNLGGFEVRVGRGDEDNDTLPFDLAAQHHLGLHVGPSGEHPKRDLRRGLKVD